MLYVAPPYNRTEAYLERALVGAREEEMIKNPSDTLKKTLEEDGCEKHLTHLGKREQHTQCQHTSSTFNDNMVNMSGNDCETRSSLEL